MGNKSSLLQGKWMDVAEERDSLDSRISSSVTEGLESDASTEVDAELASHYRRFDDFKTIGNPPYIYLLFN